MRQPLAEFLPEQRDLLVNFIENRCLLGLGLGLSAHIGQHELAHLLVGQARKKVRALLGGELGDVDLWGRFGRGDRDLRPCGSQA